MSFSTSVRTFCSGRGSRRCVVLEDGVGEVEDVPDAVRIDLGPSFCVTTLMK